MPVALDKLSPEDLEAKRRELLRRKEQLEGERDKLSKLSPAGLEVRRQELLKRRATLTTQPRPGTSAVLSDEEL